jgi:hypothetical protein
VKDLLDGAIVAFTKFLIELELVHRDAEFCPAGKIDALGMEDSLAIEIKGSRGIAAGGKRDQQRVEKRRRDIHDAGEIGKRGAEIGEFPLRLRRTSSLRATFRRRASSTQASLVDERRTLGLRSAARGRVFGVVVVFGLDVGTGVGGGDGIISGRGGRS